MKTYTQEELNEILMDKTKADFFEKVLKFRDDVWNAGFADGYKKGFEQAEEYRTDKSTKIL